MSPQSQTIAALLNNIERADKKHGPMGGNVKCLGALTLEYDEVKEAMQQREDHRVYSELIDVATVCLRRCEEILEERRAQGYTYAQLEMSE